MHAQTPRARRHGSSQQARVASAPCGAEQWSKSSAECKPGHLRCPAPPAVDSYDRNYSKKKSKKVGRVGQKKKNITN